MPSSTLTRHVFETAMDMKFDFTLSEMQVDCIVSSLFGKDILYPYQQEVASRIVAIGL